MKKFLSLVLTVMLLLGACILGACVSNDSGGQHTTHVYESTWTISAKYHYKKCTEKDCVSMSEKAEHTFVDGKCSVCEYDATIEATPNTIKSVMATLESNAIVTLSTGTYMNVTVEGVENVTLIAEEDVTVSKLTIGNNVKNFTLENVNFFCYHTETAGLDVTAATDGITLKNCTFEGQVQVSALIDGVKNVSFIGCKFLGITNGKDLSAMVIRYVENLTITDTVFDDIDYNALQIGSGYLKGSLIVTGCTFKNVKDRTFNIVRPESNLVWNISGNKIYKNTKEKNGRYFKGETILVIGANSWEEIPELSLPYFAIDSIAGFTLDGITYDVSAQTLINA